MSLPTDVVDYILSFLQSDLLTLKTCAQSHPSLSKLAERYIYAKITLRSSYEEDPWGAWEDIKTSEFIQIVTKSPNIAIHVRSLAIYVDGESNPGYSHLDTIASIMPLFTGLTKITLAGSNSWDRNNLSWLTLSEAFRQAFPRILHIQSMKDISIYDIISFPLSILNNCKNSRISLDLCRDLQYDQEIVEGLISYLTPEHLSVQHCGTTSMESVTAWLQIHNLHSLMVRTFDVKDIKPHLSRLLAACSNSLTILELDIQEDYFESLFFGTEMENDTIHLPFTLTDLFHLEQFTLAHPCMSLNTTDCSEPRIMAIAKLLDTASPTLRQVSLKFQFKFDTSPDPEDLWSPFVLLAAKCSSLSITLYICVDEVAIADYVLASNILSSMADCPGLTPYLERGVVIPEQTLMWGSW